MFIVLLLKMLSTAIIIMKDWKNKPCYRANSGKGLQARKYELSTVRFLKELKEKYLKDNVHTNKLPNSHI